MAAEFLHVEGDAEFIPATRIAREVGYTPDYISKLARDGRVASRKIGKKWYVQPASLHAFLEEVEVQKMVRSRELKEVRQRELILSQRSAARHGRIQYALQSTRHVAFAQTALIMLAGVLAPAIFFVAPANYQASAHTAGNSFLEYLAISVYEFFTPVRTEFFVLSGSDRSGTAPEHAEARDVPASSGTDGLVVFPEADGGRAAAERIRGSFSDEVEVEFDGEDTGVIRPVFRDREGEAYRFLLVPVEQKAEDS